MLLVLLHALPFGGSMWGPDAGVLGMRVLAPDLYGLGPTVGEWAEAVVHLAAGEEMLIAGCSVGGSCALAVAERAPHQVTGLALIGTKAAVRRDPAARDEALRLIERGGIAAAWERYWAPLFGSGTDAAVVDEARSLALAGDPSSVAAGVRAFHDRSDLAGVLRSWRKPLLLVSGAEDPAPSPATMRASAPAHHRFVTVERCGHYVPLERPTAWRDLLMAFAGRVQGAAAEPPA